MVKKIAPNATRAILRNFSRVMLSKPVILLLMKSPHQLIGTSKSLFRKGLSGCRPISFGKDVRLATDFNHAGVRVPDYRRPISQKSMPSCRLPPMVLKNPLEVRG